jgi:outer membrane protein insertion porin family
VLSAALASSGAPGNAAAQPQAEPQIQAPTQPDPEAGPYDGRFVRRVQILIARPGSAEFIERDDATAQLARNQIRTGAGSREYDGRIVADDILRLNRLGRFAEVAHLVEEHPDGAISVTYRLLEQPIVRDVQVTGNRRVGSVALAPAVDLLPGTPVDGFELDRAARRIEEIYRERGFYLASVRVNTDDLAETGVVLFEVREGTRVRVTSVRFDGNTSFTAGELRRQIETEVAGFFENGPLDQETLRRDARAVAGFYQDRGYLDARVDSFVQPSPDGREAIVTFYVDEGELYSLRRVVVRHTDAAETGPVLTAEQAVGLMGIKPGDTYSVNKVEQAVRTVREAYGKMGYADVSVERRELRDTTRPAVDLLLTVREGPRYRTGLVQVAGNTLTKHSEVRKVIKVSPDRPLDTTAVAESERNIASLRLFDADPANQPRAAIQQPDPERPTHRDVLFEVTETNTGLLTFGAGVNSDAGLSGRLSYTQRNFDVTDWPDSFGDLFSGKSLRGGGQTLTISAEPGTVFETYRLGLSDSSIGDSFVGGSLNAAFLRRRFSEFSDNRVVLGGGLFRRFGERWTATLNGRWQSVQLFDLEPSSTTDAFAVEGTNQLTTLGVSLDRNTVPLAERFRPWRGSITNLGVSRVGVLGGDFEYTQLSAEHTVFLLVDESFAGAKTVLRLRTSVEWIPEGQGEVPTYERFFLGGQSFRGLDFRTVSPKGVRADTGGPGDSVGGTWSFFTGLEFQQPIAGEDLALALFLDTGTVERELGFDDYRVTAGVGLRVYLPALSPAPLAFDFGFPIVSEDDDDPRLFTFSVDLPL